MNDLCQAYAQALDDMRKALDDTRKENHELREAFYRLTQLYNEAVNSIQIINRQPVKFRVLYNGNKQ